MKRQLIFQNKIGNGLGAISEGRAQAEGKERCRKKEREEEREVIITAEAEKTADEEGRQLSNGEEEICTDMQ